MHPGRRHAELWTAARLPHRGESCFPGPWPSPRPLPPDNFWVDFSLAFHVVKSYQSPVLQPAEKWPAGAWLAVSWLAVFQRNPWAGKQTLGESQPVCWPYCVLFTGLKTRDLVSVYKHTQWIPLFRPQFLRLECRQVG